MADKDTRTITPANGGGIFQDLAMRIKLIMRLMGDPRVSPFVKMLPIGALIYLFVPLDVPGPFDDALIIWLGTNLFVELCPPEVVTEHMQALKNTVSGEWKEADRKAPDPLGADEDIIDAEYWEEKK